MGDPTKGGLFGAGRMRESLNPVAPTPITPTPIVPAPITPPITTPSVLPPTDATGLVTDMIGGTANPGKQGVAGLIPGMIGGTVPLAEADVGGRGNYGKQYVGGSKKEKEEEARMTEAEWRDKYRQEAEKRAPAPPAPKPPGIVSQIVAPPVPTPVVPPPAPPITPAPAPAPQVRKAREIETDPYERWKQLGRPGGSFEAWKESQ